MQRRTCALITIASDDDGDEEDLENFILMQRFSLNLLKCHSRLCTESTFSHYPTTFYFLQEKKLANSTFSTSAKTKEEKLVDVSLCASYLN